MASKSSRLKAETLELIKAELLAKKASLTKSINTELDDMRSSSEGHHLADMDDLGGDANDEEMSFKILEIETAELGQIDRALDRIDNGAYGQCEGEECGREIGVERLKALPFAALCIDCQRKREAEGV